MAQNAEVPYREITLDDRRQRKGRFESGLFGYKSLIYLIKTGGGGDNHIAL